MWICLLAETTLRHLEMWGLCILFSVLVLSMLPLWVASKACTEAVPCLEDDFTAGRVLSALVKMRAFDLQSDLAVTTPAAEAPPVNLCLMPSFLQACLETFGIGKPYVFPFEVQPLGSDVLQG